MRSLFGIGAAATAAVMVCVAAGAGCGGSTFAAGSDAGSDGHGGGSSGSSSGGASSSSGSGGGSGSSSGGGGKSPCPASQPSDGTACMPDGLQCEYGTSPSPSCDHFVDCASGIWASNGNTICAVGTCPAHYTDVTEGATCTPDGLDCAYAEGQCDCTFSLPAGGTMPTWHCFHPTGCPEPRPRVGDACTPSQDGLMCDYGACMGGIAETCSNGYWHWTMLPCPG
jgi:hypothetical protein